MPAAAGPISLTAAATAVAGVAALYALHHLRVRAARKAVATLLFWRQSVGPQRARTPWSRRFTHLKTFLLLAANVLLLASALTADRWTPFRDSPITVLVVDAGDWTAAPAGPGRTRLDALTDAARADLSLLPDGTAVVVAGPQPLLLTEPNDPNAVADRRLRSLLPQAGASASRLALRTAGTVLGERPGRIRWYTTQARLPAGLPDEVARRVDLCPVPLPGFTAITGITFEPAADGTASGTLHVTRTRHVGHDAGGVGRAIDPVAAGRACERRRIGGSPRMVGGRADRHARLEERCRRRATAGVVPPAGPAAADILFFGRRAGRVAAGVADDRNRSRGRPRLCSAAGHNGAGHGPGVRTGRRRRARRWVGCGPGRGYRGSRKSGQGFGRGCVGRRSGVAGRRDAALDRRGVCAGLDRQLVRPSDVVPQPRRAHRRPAASRHLSGVDRPLVRSARRPGRRVGRAGRRARGGRSAVDRRRAGWIGDVGERSADPGQPCGEKNLPIPDALKVSQSSWTEIVLVAALAMASVEALLWATRRIV